MAIRKALAWTDGLRAVSKAELESFDAERGPILELTDACAEGN